MKRIVTAIALAASVAHSFAQTPAPTLEAARSLVADGRFAEARPIAEALVKAGASGAAAHDLLGQCLWRVEKPDAGAAVTELTLAATLDPKSPAIQAHLGDAVMAKFHINLRKWVKDHGQNMLGMVSRDIPTVVSGGPGRDSILFTEERINDRSMSQMTPKDWERFEISAKDALKAYNAALALDPANKPAMRGKGLASLLLGEWKDTVAAWKAVGPPAFDSFLWEIARNVTDAHAKGPESIEMWELVSQAQPKNAWAYWYLRDLYDEFRHSDWKYGYYDAMRMLFADQIRNESDARKPSPKDALKGLKEITDKHPEFGPAWRGAGMTLLVLKDKKGAAEAFQKAAAADSADWFSLNMAGLGQLVAGDAVAAQATLGKAAKLNPDDATIWLALGTAAEKNKDLDSAEMYYQRAVELSPGWPDARFSLGSLMLDRREGAQAMPHLQRYVELAPTAKNVKDVKDAIEKLKVILAKQ